MPSQADPQDKPLRSFPSSRPQAKEEGPAGRIAILLKNTGKSLQTPPCHQFRQHGATVCLIHVGSEHGLGQLVRFTPCISIGNPTLDLEAWDHLFAIAIQRISRRPPIFLSIALEHTA